MRPVVLVPALILPFSAGAAPVDVVTDIAPVAALVAEVQQGRGTVVALVEPGMDAHHLSLRPSQARAVSEAQLAVSIGPGLSPWLATALDRLAPEAPRLALLDVAPVALDRRAADDDPADGEEHGDEHGHGHDHAHGDGHDDLHGDVDPHAWLEPRNALAWLDAIAAALAEVDPEGASAYRDNAAAARAALEQRAAEVAALFAEREGPVYLAGHDSFRYAEDLAGATFAGAIMDSHATAPGPAHLARIETRLAEGDVTCILTAAGDDSRVLSQLADRFALRTVTVSPLEASIAPGGYADWLAAIYAGIADCAAQP